MNILSLYLYNEKGIGYHFSTMNLDSTDASIRPALLSFLRSREDESCVFLEEMFVDGFSRRADLVLANGHLSAFEIKSSSDTLARLEGQLCCYERYFESTTVVCAQKHLEGVLRLVSRRTGVITIGKDGAMEIVQCASLKRIPKQSWLSYLPVTELRKLLRQHGGSLPLGNDRSSLLRSCLRLPATGIREYALAYIKLRNDRNAKLRAELKRKQLDRAAYRGALQTESPEWLKFFSGAGHLKAIPRKCH